MVSFHNTSMSHAWESCQLATVFMSAGRHGGSDRAECHPAGQRAQHARGHSRRQACRQQ